jgi:hypothetical protein
MSDDGGLRPLFRQRLKSWQWTSIESGYTAGGIPDSEFCSSEGAQAWIEFKKTDAYAVVIKPLQVAWLMRRYRLNQRAFIGVRRMPKSQKEAGVDELWLMAGDQAAALQQNGLNGVHAFCWDGGPGKWNWLEIGNLLASGF